MSTPETQDTSATKRETKNKITAESPYLDEKTLCETLAIGRSTAQAWRRKGEGPRWIKVGRAVRYSREAVDAYLQANTVGKAI